MGHRRFPPALRSRAARACGSRKRRMDHETLDVLAECGIQFTILAPHQVVSAPPNGLPGEYRAANGRSVALFMYDGDLSHGVAFGGLLNNAEKWAAKMLRPRARTDASGSGRLVSIATDGETYGHHHKFGEMALARVITDLNAKKGVTVENFASFLSRNPPAHHVQLVEPTSWSCPHGVERWRSNDGCRINGAAYPSQAWRTPLRAGLDVLAAGLHAQFESEGREYFADPWAARDEYGEGVAAPSADREALIQHLAPSTQHQVRARELLEMERDALRMYSSCAWFFDDIGGLEPRQVLKYAAHACDLAAGGDPSLRPHLEKALLDYLATAQSNDATVGTGRDIYELSVRPRINTEVRVASGVAAAHALGLDTNAATPRAYDARIDDDTVTLRVVRTGRETQLHAEGSAISADSFDAGVRVSRAGVAGSELCTRERSSRACAQISASDAAASTAGELAHRAGARVAREWRHDTARGGGSRAGAFAARASGRPIGRRAAACPCGTGPPRATGKHHPVRCTGDLVARAVSGERPCRADRRVRCATRLRRYCSSRRRRRHGTDRELTMPQRPIRFVFGLHLHQPVGNFGYVFEQHVRDVYRPFLEHVKDAVFSPSRCTCRAADRMARPHEPASWT